MNDRQQRIVTLSDVAAKASVSTMTVSKVMRDVGNISQETRQRVKQAAEELGYVPNSLAGSLSSRKNRMVAIIIPSISDIVFSEVLSGINSVLRPRGFYTFICESQFDPAEEEELVRAMLSFRPAGLLLNGGMARSQRCRDLLARRNCPAIQLWDCENSGLDFSAGPSHEDAGRLVGEYFLARGLRRIAYIGAEPGKDLCATRRYQSFHATLARAGIEPVCLTVPDEPRQAQTGRQLTAQLIEAHPDIEAIHYLNDAMALGGLSCLHGRGISVPDQVSVMGFNGTSIPGQVRTRLTTIDVPRHALGQVTAQALLDMLEGKALEPCWQAPLHLVQGNTTVAA